MADRRRFLQVLAGSIVAAGMGCSGNAQGGRDASSRDGAAGDGGGGDPDATGTVDASGADADLVDDASAADAASPNDAASAPDTGPPCMPRGLNAGMASAYAAAGLYSVPRTSVMIGRDAGGLYAMTSLCTHLQCDLNTLGTIGATGVRCGCHGSQFDLVGNVTGGPASSPLRHYRLTLECDGSLRVDVSMLVAQDARLVA